MPIRTLLFVHGLESGPHGNKANYLRQHFGEEMRVMVPNVRISFSDCSTWRHLGSLRPVNSALDTCASAVMKELQEVAAEEEKSISEVMETLGVVASSWGGAVALRAMREHGLRPRRVLLLAPALAAKGWVFGALLPCPAKFDRAELLLGDFDARRITLIHGSADDTVPVEASRMFKEVVPELEYIELEGADHSLNGALGIKDTAGTAAKAPFTLKQAVERCIEQER